MDNAKRRNDVGEESVSLWGKVVQWQLSNVSGREIYMVVFQDALFADTAMVSSFWLWEMAYGDTVRFRGGRVVSVTSSR